MFRQFLEILREILDRVLTVDPNYPPESIIISGVGVSTPEGGNIGVVISAPGNKNPLEISEWINAKDEKEAVLDAIYLGLSTVLNMYPSNAYPIQIESDNKAVIKMLQNSPTEIHLMRKMRFILYLTSQVERGVKFVWRKKNSTPALRAARQLT